MKAPENYISAFYRDEKDLKEGIIKLKAQGFEIYDVQTPFPVHGLDKILGLRRSWIPRVGFIAGAIGAASGFYFQTWIFTRDYPVQIGGKPYFAVPSFIPVTFELTVLFAAFAMFFAFLFRSKLGLGAKNKIYDEGITDNRFVVIINALNATDNVVTNIKKQLSETKAEIIELHLTNQR